MKGFKGTIGFFKILPTDCTTKVVIISDLMTVDDWEEAGYVFLGATVDVDVQFHDTRAKEAEAIDKKIADLRAETQSRINTLLGIKQELLALEQSA